MRTGDDGGRTTLTFCPNCGATVYYVMKGAEDTIAIPVGAAVYEERMHPWVPLPKDIEHIA
jgi:hypothetical protein